MLRKLSIVAVASFFGKGTVGQLFCTGFISLMWIVLQVKHWPYRFAEAPPPSPLPRLFLLRAGTMPCPRWWMWGDQARADAGG